MPRTNTEGLTLKKVYIQDEHLSFIDEHYPGTTITWIMNMLLEQFVVCHGGRTPLTIANEAAEAVADTITDEDKDG